MTEPKTNEEILKDYDERTCPNCVAMREWTPCPNIIKGKRTVILACELHMRVLMDKARAAERQKISSLNEMVALPNEEAVVSKVDITLPCEYCGERKKCGCSKAFERGKAAGAQEERAKKIEELLECTCTLGCDKVDGNGCHQLCVPCAVSHNIHLEKEISHLRSELESLKAGGRSLTCCCVKDKDLKIAHWCMWHKPEVDRMREEQERMRSALEKIRDGKYKQGESCMRTAKKALEGEKHV